MTNVVQIRPTLLKREHMAVNSEGELVVISIGNSDLKLHYETALLLSQWVRHKAKEAKRRAGDNSRHWSVVGTLTDAQ